MKNKNRNPLSATICAFIKVNGEQAGLPSFVTSVNRMFYFVPDLSEPVHAWAVVGGLVPQSPSGSGPAFAAGHRLPDGSSAEAAGLK